MFRDGKPTFYLFTNTFFAMKTFFCQLVFLFGLGLLTQTATAQTAADEAAVRATLDKGLQAYYAADVESMAALYAPKALMIDYTGQKTVGREAIRQAMTEMFKFEKPSPETVQFQVESVRFLNANTALVLVNMSGTAQMDGKAIQWKGVSSMVLARTNGAWLLELDQSTPLMQPPAGN